MTLIEQELLVPAVREPEWRRDALCREADMDSFFPKGRPRNEAMRLCADCPVRETCLEWALSSPWEPYGIYAGLTPSQLVALWRQRHAQEAS